MSTGFTQEKLDALECAIAEGALRVKYSDKEIEYRSLKEMMAIRDVIKKELCKGKASSNTGLFGGRRINTVTSKGLE